MEQVLVMPVALQTQLEVACRAGDMLLLDRRSYEGVVGLNDYSEASLVEPKNGDTQLALQRLAKEMAWWVGCADIQSRYEMMYYVLRETPQHVCATCHLFVR